MLNKLKYTFCFDGGGALGVEMEEGPCVAGETSNTSA